MNDKPALTAEQLSARIVTIHQMGLATPERLRMLERWIDFVLRFEHTLLNPHGQSQGNFVCDFVQAEKHRIEQNQYRTLSSDADGYALVQIAAILSHPCQLCATDPHAWHTRIGFCNHRGNQNG